MRDAATAEPLEAHKVVLVVDDQAEVLTALRLALEPKGYDVLTESNPFEAVRVAASCEPDLIILDLDMPGMDGVEAARHLKRIEQTRNIPVIGFTGRPLGSVDSLEHRGFKSMIPKADGIESLEGQIEWVLATDRQGTVAELLR